MKKFNIIHPERNKNSDNICTREVLFEKYNPYLGSILLTDFATWDYPVINKEAVEIAIENLKERIENNHFYGEFAHEQREDGVINIANVSHSIDNVYLKEDKMYGRITLLDTPNGRILQELNKYNIEIRFELRALGTIVGNRTTIEEIITWDIVA